MHVFVVSDLHLCDGGPRDRFAYGDRPKQFNNFLNFVESEGGRLIIAGDLFDLWQCNFSKSILHYEDLLARLDRMRAVYILGNHDVDLLHFVGADFLNRPFFDRMRGPITLDDGKLKVRICHGHESDKYCAADMPGLGRITAIITALLEDRNGGPMKGKYTVEELSIGVLEKLVGWHERIWHKPPRDGQLINGLKSYVDSGECNIVVGGHTHTPGSRGDWYRNSGSWCCRANTFVYIDDDSARVFTWDNNRPILNTTQL